MSIKKRLYGKIVRDKMPHIIERMKIVEFETLNPIEKRNELIKKLSEEASEVDQAYRCWHSSHIAARLDDDCKTEVLQELGDLSDVIDELVTMIGKEDFEEIRAVKLAKRGGFKDGLYLVSVTEVIE